MAKLDLEKKLATRKGKKVSKIVYKFLVNCIANPFLLRPMNLHVDAKINVKEIKGPFIIVSNHTSRCDYLYIGKAFSPHCMNYMVSYTEFCRAHMHFIFDIAHMIPKKNFTSDSHSIKEIMQVIKQGGNVVFFPEGKSSISGTNQPIMNGTGKLLKFLNVPVYSSRISGGYMSNTQWNIANRPGKVVITVDKLFDQDDLKNLSNEELDKAITKAIYNDDFEWNKTERVKYKGNDTVADKLEEHLFWCPKCNKELTMEGHKNIIKCNNCGNGATINEYYDLIPFDNTCKIPRTLRVWYELQRRHVYEQIRDNKDFKIEENVTLGMQPNDRYVKGKKITSYPVGKGKITMTRESFTYEGTKDGNPYNFTFKTVNVPTFLLETDSSYFGTFFEGRYHEFLPERKVTTKWLLSLEECHRISGGKWQNDIPQQQWIYRELTPEEKENLFIKL